MDIYILLGYLGSGKTTLALDLRRQLLQKGKRVAVIVNDFGDGAVDGVLLRESGQTVVSVVGGSVFCSCKSDQFLAAVEAVAALKPDAVVVETSGMANPSSMLSILEFAKSRVATTLRLRSVITVVDARNFEKLLPMVHMIKMQVAFADVVCVNKSDLVGAEDLRRVEGIAAQLCPAGDIRSTKFGKIDASKLPPFNPDKVLPQNILDVKLWKYKLRLAGEIPKEELDRFCAALADRAHRIKGVIKLGSGSFVYEYESGESRLTCTDRQSENFLILLAVGGKNPEPEIRANLTCGMELC